MAKIYLLGIGFEFSLMPPYFVKKSSIILTLVIPFLFVSDMLYGASKLYDVAIPVSPGVVLRGLVFFCATLVIIRHWRLLTKDILLILMLVLFFLPIGLVIGLSGAHAILTYDVLFAVKSVFYFPVVLAASYIFIKKNHLIMRDSLFYVEMASYVLGLSLLISTLLGMSRATYGDYATGETGLFYAINDLTLALAMALAVAVFQLIRKPNVLRITLLFLTILGYAGLGTRASLLAIAIVPVMVVIVALVSHVFSISFFKKITLMVLIAPTLLLISGYFVYEGYQEFNSSSFQKDRLEELQEGDLPRLVLTLAAFRHISERSMISNIFGEGASSFYSGVYKYWGGKMDNKMRVVEVDWLDIYGSSGLVVVVVVYYLLIVSMVRGAKEFLIYRAAEVGVCVVSLGIYLVHSVLAGHGLVSPVPSTLAAFLCALLLVKTNQNNLAPHFRLHSKANLL